MSRPHRFTTVELAGGPDTLHEWKLPATFLGDVVVPFADNATVPVSACQPKDYIPHSTLMIAVDSRAFLTINDE